MKILPFVIILAAVLGCVPPKSDSGYTAPDQRKPDTSTRLELISSKGVISSNYVTVTGQVRNASAKKVDVFVVVDHYDKAGDLVATDEGITTFDPLMPGQTSTFEVMTRRRPNMKTYQISFRDGDHSEIGYDDLRRKK